MTLNIIALLTMLAVGLIIPATVGIYVFRDAARRGMNAAMWTLIALLAPSLIGFIIYLLVRGNYSDMECSNCGTSVKEEYVRCPKCGSKLRPSCPNCSAPVESDWAVCPRCAAQLTESQQDAVYPVKRRDKTLGRILVGVVIIPVVLLLITFISYYAIPANPGGTSLASLLAEEYLQEIDNEHISKWYDSCKGSNQIHILYNEVLVATGDMPKVRYLIYLPQNEDPESVQFDNNAGLFGNKIRLDYKSTGPSEERLILITSVGDSTKHSLEIYCDDKKMDYKITNVDYPLGLTDDYMVPTEHGNTNLTVDKEKIEE